HRNKRHNLSSPPRSRVPSGPSPEGFMYTRRLFTLGLLVPLFAISACSAGALPSTSSGGGDGASGSGTPAGSGGGGTNSTGVGGAGVGGATTSTGSGLQCEAGSGDCNGDA